MTRILAVHPGASYSTGDVYSGIVPELRNLGIEIVEYDLGARLEMSGRWLHLVWLRNKRNGGDIPKYTETDVVYGAGKDVIERALWHNVDGVLIFSGMFFPPVLGILLRRAGIRTAALLSESPYDIAHEMRFVPAVDVAWTNDRSSVRQLRTANPNVNYMPHAFNPAVHYPSVHHQWVPEGDTSDAAWRELGAQLRGDIPLIDPEANVPAHDVVFIGSMFVERVDLLSQIDWTGIDFGLYGEWRGLPSRHKLRSYIRGGITDNAYSAALYRKAKIGLNLYRESIGWGRDAPRITHAESMNPRTLELAACGCFQISQYREEIEEVFGETIPTFKTAAELESLIRWNLANPQDRTHSAEMAMLAVQAHTFAARARTIVDDLGRAGWPMPVREAAAV